MVRPGYVCLSIASVRSTTAQSTLQELPTDTAFGSEKSQSHHRTHCTLNPTPFLLPKFHPQTALYGRAWLDALFIMMTDEWALRLGLLSDS